MTAAATEAKGSRASFRLALRVVAFRRLLVAMGLSIAGDWLYNVALLVFVFDRTHSPGWVGAATILRLLPYIVFGAAGGALADRYERLRVMVVSDSVRALIMLALAGVAWSSSIPTAIGLILAFMSTAAGTPYVPAVAATLPSVVGEADLAAANALIKTVEHVGIVAGPALGGLLVAVFPSALAFAANAVTFALSAMLVSRINVRSLPAAATEGVGTIQRIAEGLRAVRSSPTAMALMGCIMIGACIYGQETVLLVLVSNDRLGTGSSGIGYLMAALGLGGVLAAAFTSRLADYPRPIVPLLAANFAMGLPVAALALISSPIIAFLLLIVEGAGNISIDVVVITALQRSLPSDIIARVFGIMMSLIIAATLLGALVATPIVDATNLRIALVLAGIGLPLLTLTALPALRGAASTIAARREELAPLVALLEKLSVFAGVPQQSLELLAGQVEEQEVPAGTLVVRQGEPARDFYVVRSGVFDVVSSGEKGLAPVTVNTLTDGDYFGEIGLIEGIPRTASVRARQDSVIERFDGETFLDIVNQVPSLSGTMLDSIVGRLARTHPSARPSAKAPAVAG